MNVSSSSVVGVGGSTAIVAVLSTRPLQERPSARPQPSSRPSSPSTTSPTARTHPRGPVPASSGAVPAARLAAVPAGRRGVYEKVKGAWEERFERTYGFWRGFVDGVVLAFQACGDFEGGFARVYCDECRAEYLVAFSCSRRVFCPSCAAKRAAIARRIYEVDPLTCRCGAQMRVLSFILDPELSPGFSGTSLSTSPRRARLESELLRRRLPPQDSARAQACSKSARADPLHCGVALPCPGRQGRLPLQPRPLGLPRIPVGRTQGHHLGGPVAPRRAAPPTSERRGHPAWGCDMIPGAEGRTLSLYHQKRSR